MQRIVRRLRPTRVMPGVAEALDAPASAARNGKCENANVMRINR
jgi:hypothetical protein